MTKRLVLAVCTVAAALTAVLTGTAATAPSDGATTRIMADDPPVVRPVVHPPTTGGTRPGGSGRPKPPTDTSWGG
ncbi:hypothetical protein OG352_03935 [Streptomyces sp. NBC_01485]|uniref:hypothetical protein n=1 Tax=Streptomyces sp. NBC_01485 TaxID=2903884 RepID=UPI002E2EE7BB|nr:hypothetical protein [Streptomyces sp. NBC_01485]